MEKIQLLVKLGEYQYMERLIKNGELYLRPISEFTKMDSRDGIGYRFESMITYSCPEDPSIKIMFLDGSEFSLSKKSRITYGDHSGIDYLIYCMSMVDFVKNGDFLTIKNPNNISKIGSGYDTMIIILDTNQFINRIRRAILSFPLKMVFSPVHYYSEKNITLKNLTPFYKRKCYSYQNEFRFCFDSNIDKSFCLHIGNIEDIAVIVRAKPII